MTSNDILSTDNKAIIVFNVIFQRYYFLHTLSHINNTLFVIFKLFQYIKSIYGVILMESKSSAP